MILAQHRHRKSHLAIVLRPTWRTILRSLQVLLAIVPRRLRATEVQAQKEKR